MAVLQTSPEPVGAAAGSRSKTPGAWAAVLFVIAAALMAAYLYISHEIDTFQERALALIQERTNASISVGAANIGGLRSIRLDDVRLSYRTENGLLIEGDAPRVVAALNPVAWFDDGQMVSEFTIRGGTLRIDASGYEPGGDKPDNAWLKRLPGSIAFEDFAVIVEGLRENSAIEFAGVSAQLLKEQSGNAMTAQFDGMYADDPEKALAGRIQYADMDDFECELRMNALTAGDVNAFLPEEHHFTEAGQVTPTLTVDAFPDATFAITLESEFDDVTIRDQPEFVGPLSGHVSAFARYDRETRTLAIRTARVLADELQADLSGSLVFADDAHGIDLELHASQLPVQAALEYYLPESLDEYGRIDIAFDAPELFAVTVSGTTDSYLVKATGRAPGATVSFSPEDEQFPSGSLQLGAIEAGWDSDSEAPFVNAAIRDGVVTHTDSGIEANRVSGSIRFNNNVLTIDPLTAEVFGEPFVSRAEYAVESETGTATLTGNLSKIEDTALATAIKDTDLAGAVDVNATATFADGIVTATGGVEATNTVIDYNWWFSKPAGIGARAEAEVTFKPDEIITIVAKAEVASSNLDSRIDWNQQDGKWRLKSAKTTSDSVDVVSAAKCIRVPYTITGGTLTDGYHEWKRGQTAGVLSEVRVGGTIDRIKLLPETGETPITIENVTVESLLTKGDNNFGDMTVEAEKASLPPFGQVWFRPLREDGLLLERFPPVPRRWTYSLKADALSAPPWEGINFTGETISDNGVVTLDPYRAEIDDGWVEGAYTSNVQENWYETRLNWENIDTKYFIAHLGMEDVLTGRIDGHVTYGMDRDDPGTLKGDGEFTISEGQFSADFVINLIERQMQGETSTLPPSLKFERLYSKVDFEGDIVKTPQVELDAEGIIVRGNGQYVNDGDMDYTLNLSISPETASQIPALRDNLNLQGYEMAQKMIELPFHVTGPTGAPVGAVTDAPPMRVTLVTGALEVTREAFNVLDAPRKILVDLLKTAGGLVGARKSGADNGT